MNKFIIIIMLLLGVSTLVTAQRHEKTDFVDAYYDSNGNRHGYCKTFFGPYSVYYNKVMAEGNFVHGVPDGIHKTYDAPGIIASETKYKMGTPLEIKYYHSVSVGGNSVRRLWHHQVFSSNGKELIKEWKWNPKNETLELVRAPLPNGRGYYIQSIYPLDGETSLNYEEHYIGNDTTYVWYDNTKQHLRRKSTTGYAINFDREGKVISETGGSRPGKKNYSTMTNIDGTHEEWTDGNATFKRFTTESDGIKTISTHTEGGSDRLVELIKIDMVTGDKYKWVEPEYGVRHTVEITLNDKPLLKMSSTGTGNFMPINYVFRGTRDVRFRNREVLDLIFDIVPDEVRQLFENTGTRECILLVNGEGDFYTTRWETAKEFAPEFAAMRVKERPKAYVRKGDALYLISSRGEITPVNDKISERIEKDSHTKDVAHYISFNGIKDGDFTINKIDTKLLGTELSELLLYIKKNAKNKYSKYFAGTRIFKNFGIDKIVKSGNLITVHYHVTSAYEKMTPEKDYTTKHYKWEIKDNKTDNAFLMRVSSQMK